MNTATIPVPRSQSREEWPETDFDLPDGDLFPPNLELELEKEEDLGSSEESTKFRSLFFTEDTATNLKIQDFIVRPPVFSHDDDDEGVSTIKASGFTVLTNTITESPTEDDFESSFTFPSDLEKLSSRPFSLSHRASKGSMEWGDKDHTSSSTSSSETYSSLGFGAGTSPSTISTSASLPVTDDEIEGDIEGLILPVGLFDSNHGQKELERLLELKKKLPIIEEQSVANLDPEDDFEVGLVIDNDDELSPSRLLGNVRASTHADAGSRSKSMPAVNRPPSRTKQGSLSGTGWTAGKADNRNAPMSYSGSRRNFQLQSTPSSSSALLKSSHLRGQKSHTGLKSTSPPSNQRRLGRKASLSSLIEASHPRALPENDVQVHGVSAMKSSTHKYNTSTAASRAKVQNTYIRNNQSGIDRNGQSSSRPSTPLNIIGNRSTLPINLSRVKSRTPVSTVFGSALPYPRSSPPLFRLSPLEKNTTCSTPRQPLVTPSTTKLFRRSKRRLYGNGTELDDIEDLPTDRDKEARFSVKPKLSQKNSNGNINKEEREFTKGSIRLRRTMTRSPCPQLPSDASSASPVSLTYGASMLENANTRKRPSNLSLYKALRKPTLIRGLGGPGASKVVAGMRWNPQTLRWEGNEHVLRDFDAVAASSTRPALITHLTGSSIGSPTGSFGSATRIVGNMIFDPVQMCWMSNLPSEEDEPDIFANLGDDEDEVDVSDERGDTIRAQRTQIHLLHKKISNTSNSNASADYCMSDTSTAMRSRSLSESESDRGSRASLVCHVDDKFLETCRAAESQHRAEMKGWLSDPTSSYVKDRSSLYEIRALATRQY